MHTCHRFLACLLAILATFTLTACRNSGSGSETEAAGTDTTAAESTPAETEAETMATDALPSTDFGGETFNRDEWAWTEDDIYGMSYEVLTG